MRRTKLFTAVITALTAVSLCGCANVDGEVPAAPLDEISQQTSEMISGLTDSTSDVSASDGETSTALGENNAFPSKCKIYKQTIKLFSEEQLLSLFSGTPEKVETSFEGRTEYRTDTERGLVDNEGALLFLTPAGNKFDTICEMHFLEENNIKGYEDEELDFATRDEILKQVEALTRDILELPPEDWYAEKFYAVKKEVFDKYKQAIIEEAASPETKKSEYWTERLNAEVEALNKLTGEDYYFLSIGFKIDDIQTYPNGIFYYAPNNSNAIIGSRCSLVITKNGIEYAYFSNMRDTDTVSAEESDIISPDEAKALMRQKIAGVIWDGEIEINDMKLEYLPIPQNDLGEYFTNFETRPYYAFYFKVPEKNDDSIIMSNQITYFDAVTGAELGTQWIDG